MRIAPTRLGGTTPQAAARPTGGGFSLAATEGAAKAETAEISKGLGVYLDALLLAQEAADEGGADRAGRLHGHQVLQALTALQRARLGHGDLAPIRAALDAVLAQIPSVAHPDLRDILAAIAVRARIELAR